MFTNIHTHMGGIWFGFSPYIDTSCAKFASSYKVYSYSCKFNLHACVNLCLFVQTTHKTFFFSTSLCLTTIPAVQKPALINTGSLLEHRWFNSSRGASYRTAIKCSNQPQDTRVLRENAQPGCTCKCTHVDLWVTERGEMWPHQAIRGCVSVWLSVCVLPHAWVCASDLMISARSWVSSRGFNGYTHTHTHTLFFTASMPQHTVYSHYKWNKHIWQ